MLPLEIPCAISFPGWRTAASDSCASFELFSEANPFFLVPQVPQTLVLLNVRRERHVVLRQYSATW